MISRRMCHKFGPSFTRNAILGKRHRMGMAKRTKEGDTRVKRDRPKAPRVRFCKPKTKIDLPPVITDDQIPRRQRKSIWELAQCDCRWPVGEVGSRDFFYCGAPALDWSRYCAVHHWRAHNKAVEARPKVIGTGFHTRTKEGKAA